MYKEVDDERTGQIMFQAYGTKQVCSMLPKLWWTTEHVSISNQLLMLQAVVPNFNSCKYKRDHETPFPSLNIKNVPLYKIRYPFLEELKSEIDVNYLDLF